MSFSFTLDSFNITNTRAAHKDTAYVAFTLQVVGQGGPITQTKSIGSVNNGSHKVNLQFNNVQVNPTDTVVLNYFIVNDGRDSRVDVELALERVGRYLASGESGAPPTPQLTSAMTSQAVADWFALQLQGIYSPGGCDGLVAAEQDTFTLDELSRMTPTGKFSHTTQHAGTEPPAGCNKKVSGYSVNWHIVGPGDPSYKPVPDVIGKTPKEAADDLKSAGFTAFIPQGTPGNYVVSTQTPAPFTPEPLGKTISLVFVKPPVKTP